VILAADIGGTRVRCALAPRNEPGRRARDAVLRTADIDDPVAALVAFAVSSPRPIRAAVLGVAGPVFENAVRGANLPWTVDGAELSRGLAGAPTLLVNDLEAAAHAIAWLGADETVTLHAGIPRDGHRVVISPGTGLGEAVLVRRDGNWIPVAGEGGHADFAARTEEEADLLAYLRGIFGRVSWERVVSGQGLVNVFCWQRDRSGIEESPAIPAFPGRSEPAAEIGEAALRGTSRLAAEAVRVWCGALGAEAGNAALRVVARGGVYLGGGIPPRLLSLLRASAFVEAFCDKAPHEALLREFPVHVVTAEDAALRGALHLAAGLAAGERAAAGGGGAGGSARGREG
jgi:glucokinase